MSALLAFGFVLFACTSAEAQFDPLRPPLSPEKRLPAETDAAKRAIKSAAEKGPAKVDVAAVGTLDLPAGYSFVPQREAARFARTQGESGRGVVGLIVTDQDPDNPLELEYVASAHILDDALKAASEEDWQGLIEDAVSAAAAGNLPTFLGWSRPPNYDGLKHRGSFAANFVETDAGSSTLGEYVGFELGRNGYFGLRYDAPTLQGPKIEAASTALKSIAFKAGSTYDDFNPKTDKTISDGAAALVATPSNKGWYGFALGMARQKIFKIAAFAILIAFVGAEFVGLLFGRVRALGGASLSAAPMLAAAVRVTSPPRDKAPSDGDAAMERFQRLARNKAS